MQLDDDGKREHNGEMDHGFYAASYRADHSLSLLCLLSAAIYVSVMDNDWDEVNRMIVWGTKHHQGYK